MLYVAEVTEIVMITVSGQVAKGDGSSYCLGV